MRDSDEYSFVMIGRVRDSLSNKGAESERLRMKNDLGDIGVGEGLTGGAGVGGVGLLKSRGESLGRDD